MPRASGARLIVDATFGLGARELRVDDWGIDVCVAGVDYAIGAPAGMSLVTYSPRASKPCMQRAAHAADAPAISTCCNSRRTGAPSG